MEVQLHMNKYYQKQMTYPLAPYQHTIKYRGKICLKTNSVREAAPWLQMVEKTQHIYREDD